jgi:hypothetical protein
MTNSGTRSLGWLTDLDALNDDLRGLCEPLTLVIAHSYEARKQPVSPGHGLAAVDAEDVAGGVLRGVGQQVVDQQRLVDRLADDAER